jgi:hypothetical protein
MTNVYEMCGTYQAATGRAVFPIDIIEAADTAQALENRRTPRGATPLSPAARTRAVNRSARIKTDDGNKRGIH